jgi:glutamate--cysteine ligase
MAAWEQLAERFHRSVRPRAERRVGIEIERIGMWRDGYSLHYREGKSAKGETRPGAEALLTEVQKRQGWEAVLSPEGKPLGFHSPYGKISLEPGSQLEISGDPVNDIPEMVHQIEECEKRFDEVARPWGLRWLGIGVNPLSTVEQLDVIPSPRYHIMTDYLGKRDTLGTTMMRLTSSIQLNLDYTSESEAIEMLRAALAAAPVSYALFGNSPLSQGAPSGFVAFRGEVWRHTDPDRGGLMDEAFVEGFDFVTYAERAWHRPLMFAQAPDTHYVAAKGNSLADIAAGKLPGVEVDSRNQTNSVQEIFTEARLKPGYIEVRSIDGLGKRDRYAAAAFWLGLLYGESARALAIEHLGGKKSQLRHDLNVAASRLGMQATAGQVSILPIARELVAAAKATLVERGKGEEKFLAPVEETLATGKNPGQIVLEKWNGEWKGDFGKLFDHCAI